MTDLSTLSELEHEDPELVPDILPVDARLSLRGPVAVLIALFERAASVTPAKEIIAGTGYALLEAFPASFSEVAYARITATDGEQTISVIVDGITVSMGGAVLVPGKKILEILKNTPTDLAKIEVLGNAATIRSGRAQWTVQTPTGDALPPMPEVADIELHEVPRDSFLRGLTVARKAVAITNARASLMQASIRNGSITACDGGRVHRQYMEGFPTQLDLSIPLKVIDELTRMLKDSSEDNIQLGASDYHLVFRIGSDSLVAQRLLVAFPDVEALLLGPAFSNQNSLTVDSQSFMDVIKRVRVNADPDYSSIYLVLVPGKKDDDGLMSWSLAVRARDRIGNSAQESLECQWVGNTKPRELCLNHRYLSDLISSFGQGTVIFKIGDDTKSSRMPLFLEDKTLGFTGIVQQMSLSRF